MQVNTEDDWWVYMMMAQSFISLLGIYVIVLCNTKVIMAELEDFDKQSSSSHIT